MTLIPLPVRVAINNNTFNNHVVTHGLNSSSGSSLPTLVGLFILSLVIALPFLLWLYEEKD